MKTFFEKQLTYQSISFYMGNSPILTEREMHSYHEILFYMGEKALLLSEGGQQQINGNTLVMIPKETYHFFKLSDGAEFPRVKISFPDSVISDTPLSSFMSQIKIIDCPGEEIILLLGKLQRTIKGDCDEKAMFYLHSVFMLLMAELTMLDLDDIKRTAEANSHATSITDYISANLSADLDIKALSRNLHLSPSHITHMFKREYGISIHKFIIQKRLLLARNLILGGKQPSKIYPEVGFKDYSAFYKAYLSFFGYPPSQDKP